MLHFDLNAQSLLNLGMELGATDLQLKFALSRALRRTAATLRKLSERGLRDELQLRTLGGVRRRLRSLHFRRAQFDSVQLWYGLNDMPISYFKGRPKKTKDGAQFRGVNFPGGFIAKGNRGRRTIFKRYSTERLPIVEQALPLKDRMDVYVEDEIFTKTESIFWSHFERDLRARTAFGVGQQDEYRPRKSR